MEIETDDAMRCRVVFLTLTTCLWLGACSLYTFGREWNVGVSTDQYPTAEAQDAAFTEKWSHFHADLRTCVAENDPKHLRDVDDGRSYRIDGWFLDQEHTDAVIACMCIKGYSVSGPAM
jgi:hypothetical protein